jgi:hypothetical protein
MMEKPEFELIGYDRPRGSYPAPARPIVKNPGYNNDSYQYLAVYLDDNLRMDSEPIHPKSEFIHLSPTQKQKLKLENFDCRKHRLFAVSENIVRFYKPQDEAWFFGGLLCDEDFSYKDPLFRISLAKKIKDRDTLIREFDAAEQYIQQHDQDLILFLEKEKSKLLEPTISTQINIKIRQPNQKTAHPKNISLVSKILGKQRCGINEELYPKMYEKNV